MRPWSSTPVRRWRSGRPCCGNSATSWRPLAASARSNSGGWILRTRPGRLSRIVSRRCIPRSIRSFIPPAARCRGPLRTSVHPRHQRLCERRMVGRPRNAAAWTLGEDQSHCHVADASQQMWERTAVGPDQEILLRSPRAVCPNSRIDALTPTKFHGLRKVSESDAISMPVLEFSPIRGGLGTMGCPGCGRDTSRSPAWILPCDEGVTRMTPGRRGSVSRS